MSTTTARSGQLADVQSAIRTAKEGDTVIIPKGTYTWAGQLAIDGGTFSDGSPRGKSVNLIGADGVTIINNYKVSSTWADQNLIQVQTGPESTLEIAGISFEEGPALAGGGSIGHAFLRLSYKGGWGQSAQSANNGKVALIHKCGFQMKGNTSFSIRAIHRGGVIYNCAFSARGTGNEVGVQYQGEGSWRQPSSWGALDSNGSANTYIEDCSFSGFGNGYAFDVSGGARMVIRHNKFNSSLIGSHGLESDPTGMRHAEIYNNTFITPGPYTWIHMRGGSWVVFGNSFGSGPNAAITMTITALNRRVVMFAPPCPKEYPVPRQIGQGWSGGAGSYSYKGYESLGDGNITEAVCIWNNTSKAGTLVGFSDDPDTCGNKLKSADFVKLGRDYLLSAKSGYTPYAYPHPLRKEVPVAPPEPPPITPQPPPMANDKPVLEVIVQGSNSVRLAWTSPGAPGGQWFRIYRGREPAKYSSETDVGDVRSTTIEGLAQGSWYFMVRRYISGSASVLLSDEVKAEVGSPNPPPPPGTYNKWITSLTEWIRSNPPVVD